MPLTRRAYARAWLQCAWDATVANWRKYNLGFAIFLAVLYALVLYIKANDVPFRRIFTAWPWNWDTSRSGGKYMSELLPTLTSVLVALIALFLWNLICSPYRMQRDAERREAAEAARGGGASRSSPTMIFGGEHHHHYGGGGAGAAQTLWVPRSVAPPPSTYQDGGGAD